MTLPWALVSQCLHYSPLPLPLETRLFISPLPAPALLLASQAANCVQLNCVQNWTKVGANEWNTAHSRPSLHVKGPKLGRERHDRRQCACSL